MKYRIMQKNRILAELKDREKAYSTCERLNKKMLKITMIDKWHLYYVNVIPENKEPKRAE